MALLGELYLKAPSKEAQTKISTLMENYSKSGTLPALKEIPGALDTVRSNSHYRPPVSQTVINNLNNEIKDADISISRYSAEMEAATKCRGDAKCDEAFKKASEEKAKALNRKSNTASALDEYRLVGFLPSNMEKVGQAQGHAPETGAAKPEEMDKAAATTAANQTTSQANSTFTATGTGLQQHEGLDPSKMNITLSTGFAGQLVMKAIGMTGRGLLLCRDAILQSDVMVYVAGSVIYVAGEIISYMQFSKAQKALKEEVDQKKLTDGMQKESLIKMKETLLEMRKVAVAKKNLQMGAATAFFSAAAIAAGKYGVLVAARGMCVTGCMAAAAAILAVPHGPKKPECAKAMSAAPERVGKLCSADPMAVISSLMDKQTKTIEATSKAKINPCPPCGPICTPSYMLESSSWVVCPASPPPALAVIGYFNKETFGKYIAAMFREKPPVIKESFAQKIFNNLFNRAQAAGNFSTLFGLGGAAATMLSGLVYTEWTIFDKWIHGPLGRSIVFSLTGAFAVAEAQMNTQKTIDKIDERLAFVDAILAKIGMPDASKLSAERILADMNLSASSTMSLSANIPNPSGTPSAIPFPCVSRPSKDDPNSNNLPQTKKGCISLHAINSKSFSSDSFNASEKTSGEQQIKTIGDSKLWNGKNVNINGSDINGLVSSAAKVADSIQGEENLSGEAINGAAALGEKLSLAQNALKNAEDNTNKALKDQGEATVNFSGLRESLTKDLKQGVLKDLKKNKMSPEEALKQLGTSSPSDSDASSKSKNEKASTNSGMEEGQNTYNTNLGLPPSAANASVSDLKASAGTTDQDKNKQDPLDYLTAGDKKKGSEKGEEIINRPDNSIFQIISVRYLKSGLKRLGYLKKVTTESLATPTPAPSKN